MQFRNIILIFINVILVIIGALFSIYYGDNVFVFWGLYVLIISFVSQYIVNRSKEIEVENADLKFKISRYSIRKNNTPNALSLAVLPLKIENGLKVNQHIELDIVVQSVFEINEVPDIKLISNSNNYQVLNVASEVKAQRMGGSFEYFLNKPNAQKINEYFIKYRFGLKVLNSGKHHFCLVCKNDQFEENVDIILKIK